MVITASEARSQLFPLIEQVNLDSKPVTITSKKGNAILVSESEWESMIETMYVLRTSTNRERLSKSIDEMKNGKLYLFNLPLTPSSKGKKLSKAIAPSTTKIKSSKKPTRKTNA